MVIIPYNLKPTKPALPKHEPSSPLISRRLSLPNIIETALPPLKSEYVLGNETSTIYTKNNLQKTKSYKKVPVKEYHLQLLNDADKLTTEKYDLQLDTIHEECSNNLPTVPNNNQWEAGHLYTLIPGKLFFTAFKDEVETLFDIKMYPAHFYFSSSIPEQYIPFCADFGPCNLETVVQFCHEVQKKITHPKLQKRKIIYYCTTNPTDVTNTAFCLAAYLLLVHKYTPQQAVQTFVNIQPTPLIPFRDATFSEQTHHLHISACISGLARACVLGWFNWQNFDSVQYVQLSEDYDLSILCPKFVAFRGPRSRPRNTFDATPQELAPILLLLGVKQVVRLNSFPFYDTSEFSTHGLLHTSLLFDDCTNPDVDLVEKFLDICDQCTGKVAVHCLAGLGRTGTLIAIWLMKHEGFTADGAIGYLRIVRPGSVIGPQQHYLQYVSTATWVGNRYIPAKEGYSAPATSKSDSNLMAQQVYQGLMNKCSKIGDNTKQQ